MNTIILTSHLDFYDNDKKWNKFAHGFGNKNGILDCLKANLKNRENFVFVSNGTEGEKAEEYFNLACKSFDLSLPFKRYDFLTPSAKTKAKDLIKNADLIFLSGGHVPVQNKFFNEIGLKALLKNNTKALIVGNSAGGVNCADVVYSLPILEKEVLDDNFNKYLKGLGLININVIPHFEQYQKMVVCGKNLVDDIVIPESYKTSFVAINDGSYIVIKDKKVTICGECYKISNGQIKKIDNLN